MVEENAQLKNIAEVMDEAMEELKEDVKKDGFILDPGYPKAKQDLKVRILERAGVSEEDFDNFAKTQGSKFQELQELQDAVERKKWKDEQREKSDKRRLASFNALLEKAKGKSDLISDLPEEELKNRVETIIDETERVYGETSSREKTKYTKELLADFVDELEESKKDKIVEAKEKLENENLKKEVGKEWEKIKESGWWSRYVKK